MNLKNCFNAKIMMFVALIACIIFAIAKMTDIALLVFVSYVISSAINPFIDKLSKKMPRTFATVLMIAIVVLIVIGLLVPIIVMAINEIKDFMSTSQSQLDNAIQFLKTQKFNNKTLLEVMNMDTVVTNSAGIVKELIGRSINFTMSFVGVITVLVTMGIVVFFLSNDRYIIKGYCLKLFPASIRTRASEVIDELEVKVGGYVSAQLSCITIVGLIVTVGLMLLKVNYAVFLGLISAIFDLVPIVGPTVAGILILLVATSKGPLVSVLAVLVMLFAQFVENNWAKPYFFSKYMDLHPLVVIFSFVIAAKFLGVIGVLVAPAIAAVLITLFDELYIKSMNEDAAIIETVSEDSGDNG